MAPTAPAQGRGSGSLMWLQGLVCGALLAFATPTAVLLAVLLCPAAAAWLADTQPGRPVARAVAVAALGPALRPVWHLWLTGGGMATTLELLSDPATLCLAWGAASCGWALCQVLPVVLRTMHELRAAARAKAIQTELEMHREAWEFH